MCLLLIATQPSPDIDFVIAHNRDESINRPFENAKLREYGSKKVICGLDTETQGTWAGIKLNGEFACVHNIRDLKFASQSAQQSRGRIPLELLGIEKNKLSEDAYKPFTSIKLDLNQQIHIKSFDGIKTTELRLTDNSAKIFGISNLPITTHCHKSEIAKLNFEKILSTTPVHENAEDLIRKITTLMTSDAMNEYTPDTGYPDEIEKLLSSNFIQSENYQTLTTTIILKRSPLTIEFIEIDHRKGTTIHLWS